MPKMKVFARAQFENYKVQPWQIAIKILGPVTIEVFKDTGEVWKARTLPTGGVHKELGGPADYVMRGIAERFENQLTPWEWVDETGSPAPAPGTDVLTHIIGEHRMQAGLKPNVHRTLCGKLVLKGRIVKASAAKCEQCQKALAVVNQNDAREEITQ
jgi:hypothetical protein